MILNLGKDLDFEVSDELYFSDLANHNYIGIYIVQLNKASGSSIIHTFISEHEGLVEETYDFPQDGYYTIAKIIIPEKDNIGQLPEDVTTAYYYEKQDNGTYKYWKDVTDPFGEGDGISEVDLIELVEVNTEGTNIYRELLNYFSTCYLYKCYVNICKETYKDILGDSGKYGKRCSCSSEIDTNLKYRRDLVQSTLSVIQYLVDCGQYAEAEIILERIGSCNGICPTANNVISQSRCGCRK